VVGVGVGVNVGVCVFVNVAEGVGVLVPVGVEFVGEFVGVGEEAVEVGDGVAPGAIEIVCRPLLLDISGSASFPITPATTLRAPATRGVRLTETLATPVAGHVTVVEESLVAALAKHPAEDPAALNATAGWKINVTVTPDAPPGTEIPTLTVRGEPTFPEPGAETFATDRSYDCANRSAASPAATATRTALREDRAPAMRPPFDASPAQVVSISTV